MIGLMKDNYFFLWLFVVLKRNFYVKYQHICLRSCKYNQYIWLSHDIFLLSIIPRSLWFSTNSKISSTNFIVGISLIFIFENIIHLVLTVLKSTRHILDNFRKFLRFLLGICSRSRRFLIGILKWYHRQTYKLECLNLSWYHLYILKRARVLKLQHLLTLYIVQMLYKCFVFTG